MVWALTLLVLVMLLVLFGAGLSSVDVANCTASGERPVFQAGKAHPESHGVGLRVVDQVAARFGTDSHVSFYSQAHTICICVELGKRAEGGIPLPPSESTSAAASR